MELGPRPRNGWTGRKGARRLESPTPTGPCPGDLLDRHATHPEGLGNNPPSDTPASAATQCQTAKQGFKKNKWQQPPELPQHGGSIEFDRLFVRNIVAILLAARRIFALNFKSNCVIHERVSDAEQRRDWRLVADF